MRDGKLLVVDDDATYRTRLVRAMASRGIDAHGAADAAEALRLVREHDFDKAVVDLRMPGPDGLEFVRKLKAVSPHTQVVVVTGYGSIATAVEAVKHDVLNVLTKPADADQILLAFAPDDERVKASAEPAGPYEAPTLDRVEWEHIQRVLSDCGGNITKAAKVLGIHRRSLQRKLQRFAPQR